MELTIFSAQNAIMNGTKKSMFEIVVGLALASFIIATLYFAFELIAVKIKKREHEKATS